MDLQAILNESDSSLDDARPSSSLSDDDDRSHHVDLERILREDDDEHSNDDDDDDILLYHQDAEARDPTNMSMSTISTAAHHYHLKQATPTVAKYSSRGRGLSGDAALLDAKGKSPLENSGMSSSASRYNHSASHNAEDWAVLQQILGEEDDDDDDDDEEEDSDPLATMYNSRVKPKSPPRSIKKPDIDAILNYIDKDNSDDLDENLRLGPTSLNRSPPRLQSEHDEDFMLRKLDTSYLEGSSSAPSSPRSPRRSTLEIGEKQTRPTLTLRDTSSIRTERPARRDEDDVSSAASHETVSAKAIAYAEAYEQRLLRPSQRDIVSPLMVKRRLKPRIELGSRMQQKNQDLSSDIPQLVPSSSATSHAPRYGFSGIMENKVMPGLTKQMQENESNKEIGLPTALAVNSKFIAIGTQKGIVIVFDLFEVLRQKLGHRTISDGSWTKGQGGAVTSIDIADNGEALIAGYTSGVVVLWDIIKGLVLRKITDTHPSPITAVRFLPTNDLKVVTVDAGGLVNKLNFSRNIIWANYSVDTECLLDGTAGQILAMNVLPPLSSLPQYARDGLSSSMYPPILKRLVLIALSSGRSSFAVAVEPAISVLHRWAKPDIERIENPGGPDVDEVSLDLPEGQPYLPCLSWGWALVSGGGHVVTPILARAWGCCVQLLRASFPDYDENGPGSAAEKVHWPAFGIHDEFQVSAPIVALEWMGERSLVQLTLSNELMVVDTVMMTLVERLDFSGLRLVYAEFSLSRSAMSAEKREANGGSSDDEPMGETYCSTFLNSIRSSDSRLLVLCQAEVKRISLLGARQRISALEQDGEWLEALALALDHYENTIKSQEDRRRDPEGILDLSKHPEFISARRSEDEEWIAKLLIRYLNLAVENAPEPSDEPPSPTRSSMQISGRLDLAQSHYQMLAGVCIEFCVVSRRLDLLFGPIFRRFHAVGYLPIFLDVLEPYVLNDKLKYIAPEAMAYFVEHCKATSGVATVERCLLHMDVTIVDFDSILSLLRRNEMYSALSYVYTHGLDDFVAPLEIMLDRVFDSADEGNVVLRRRADGAPQNDFESVGYKTIVYLRHCFQGKDFPQGATLKPEDKLKSVRPQLLRFLLREKYKPPRRLHSEVLGYRTLPYPYTHILLMVDARALLDTLSLALDAPDEDFAQSGTAFESIGGWEVEVGADSVGSTPKLDLNASGESDAVPDRQLIITMLSSIILPDEEIFIPDMVGNLSHNKGAVDAFLDFMAKYLLQGVVRANKSVTFLILSRMANRFAKASRAEDRQLAQEQIIELITALPRNAYEPDDVLRLVEEDGIHRAALVLHQQCVTTWHEGEDDSGRRSHHFQSAIDCYLEDADADFRKEVFAYAKKECATSGDPTIVAETDLRSSLCSKLRDLVNLDAVLSAQLVAELYIDELDRVVNVLDDGAENAEQFKLLDAVISGELAKVDPVAGPVLNANLTMDHHQTYLTLMAKHHPDMVYQYLSTHDNYRPEECLKLCQKYEIADASAYLLERMGNVSSALQLILQKLEGRLMGLKRTMRGMSTDVFRNSTSRWLSSDWNRDDDDILRQKEKQANEIDGVKRILVVALDLCERNSGAMARNEQSSQLWFNTLDRLINAKGFLRLSKEQPVHAKAMAEVLGTLLQMTMQRMVSSVPMPDLVRKVTTDHSGSRLGELREMIESLLGTYGYELQVCSKAVKVMNHDVKIMEQENRRLQMEGSRVDSIMNNPLDSKTASRQEALSSSLSSDACTLVIGQDGNALFSEDDRRLHQEGSRGGLGDALHRLRARRETQSDSDQAAHRPQSGLSMLSQSDQLYNAGESSEAADHSVRVGVLGAAEHYGSFS